MLLGTLRRCFKHTEGYSLLASVASQKKCPQDEGAMHDVMFFVAAGAAAFQLLQMAGRVVYQTRLEEMLFGMSYVATTAAAEDDGLEE